MLNLYSKLSGKEHQLLRKYLCGHIIRDVYVEDACGEAILVLIDCGDSVVKFKTDIKGCLYHEYGQMEVTLIDSISQCPNAEKVSFPHDKIEDIIIITDCVKWRESDREIWCLEADCGVRIKTKNLELLVEMQDQLVGLMELKIGSAPEVTALDELWLFKADDNTKVSLERKETSILLMNESSNITNP